MHALLLSPQYSPHLMERAGAVLNATLRPLAAAEPAAAPAPARPAVVPGRPLPAAAATARTEHYAVPALSPVAVSPAPTFPAAGAGGSEIVRAAEPAGVAAAGAARAAPPRAVSFGTSGGTGAGAGIDADGLRQYRLALAREARRYKHYPERAMLAGIGGTAQVRIDIGVDGSVRSARLAESSGNDSLDAAAVAMVRQAAPRALLPEMLRGRAFPVTLPIIFNPDAD